MLEFKFGGGLNKNRMKREQGIPPVSGLSNPKEGVTFNKDRRDAALWKEKSKVQFWTCSFESSNLQGHREKIPQGGGGWGKDGVGG